MNAQANIALSPAATAVNRRELRPSLVRLKAWVEQRDFAGWEPYDLLNSPFLSRGIRTNFPLNWLAIQVGKRSGWTGLRRLLRVPSSKNPKALALFLSGFCDLARMGESAIDQAEYLVSELLRLRSPGEIEYCWGYDWPFVSVRGAQMPAFSPNAIATVACGEALLDAWEQFGSRDAFEIAQSVGRFIVTRLNRSVDLPDELCFSYTPANRTRIYNSSALCCAFLVRLGRLKETDEHASLARRGMQYLANRQRDDGSWAYGEGGWQNWIDSFHTGFNLSALLAYQSTTSDHSFEKVLDRGIRFYVRSFFDASGIAKYTPDSIYPIDIHSCSQALLTLSDFSACTNSLDRLLDQVLCWTEKNMQSPEGFFYYQRHRFWTNRMPYLRWGQAWMFRALARLELRSRATA